MTQLMFRQLSSSHKYLIWDHHMQEFAPYQEEKQTAGDK